MGGTSEGETLALTPPGSVLAVPRYGPGGRGDRSTALAGGGELLTTRIASAALIVSPAAIRRAVAVYSLPAQPVSPPACAKCPTGAGIRPLRLHALQFFQHPRLHQ